jgi:Endonuclease-reverse transcriptase
MDLGNLTNHTDRNDTGFRIWQQNVNKSQICQHDLISSARLTEQKIDLVALQELAISDLAVTIASRDWRVIYPSMHAKDPSKTRSVILICTNILTNNWSQIDIDSGDVAIVKISGAWGKLTIFNIYNNCDHDNTIELLKDYQRHQDDNELNQHREDTHTVWLGDFNRHHPHWDNITDNRLFTRAAIKKAEKLIAAVADARLDLALSAKIPTHKHNVTKKWTRLDHVFLSEQSFDALISCEALVDNLSPNTDHLPILTKLDLTLAKTPAKSVPNFRNVDWESFRKTLEGQLSEYGLPRTIKDQGELDQECSRLTTALQTTIQKEVPTAEIGPRSKQWWTKELTL